MTNAVIAELKSAAEWFAQHGKNTNTAIIGICNRAVEVICGQKAEIERLQKIIVGFMDEVGTWSNKYNVDISNIHRLPLLAKEDLSIRNNIKSEEIKEFAEELKNKFTNSGKSTKYGDFTWGDIKSYEIDNLLAEMTDNITKVEHNSLCETETYKKGG